MTKVLQLFCQEVIGYAEITWMNDSHFRAHNNQINSGFTFYVIFFQITKISKLYGLERFLIFIVRYTEKISFIYWEM